MLIGDGKLFISSRTSELIKPQVVVVKSNKELLETYYNKHKKKFSREIMKDWTKIQNLLLKEY